MSLWVVAVIAVVIAAVVALLAAPVRGHRTGGADNHARAVQDGATAWPAASELPDLEAAREAKYREIRDAELDFRTGKLSEEDYRAIDATLRAEAIEILRRLEAAHGR